MQVGKFVGTDYEGAQTDRNTLHSNRNNMKDFQLTSREERAILRSEMLDVNVVLEGLIAGTLCAPGFLVF